MERTTITDAEDSLEQIETYLRAGWHDTVGPKITRFEETYGTDFKQFASEAPGLDDPR